LEDFFKKAQGVLRLSLWIWGHHFEPIALVGGYVLADPFADSKKGGFRLTEERNLFIL
jgi:hypothetical protein